MVVAKEKNRECVSGRYDKRTINLNRVIWQVDTIFTTLNPKCLRENASQFERYTTVQWNYKYLWKFHIVIMPSDVHSSLFQLSNEG